MGLFLLLNRAFPLLRARCRLLVTPRQALLTSCWFKLGHKIASVFKSIDNYAFSDRFDGLASLYRIFEQGLEALNDSTLLHYYKLMVLDVLFQNTVILRNCLNL